MKQLMFIVTILILCAGVISAQNEPERTITVLGMASTDILMDKVNWSLNVIVKESNQEKLRKKADIIIADIKAACKRLGIDSDKIEFSKVNISMNYQGRNRDKFSHYELSQYVSLIQEDVDSYDAFWQEFTSIEGIRVSQKFFSSVLDETRKELRAEAVESAKVKAAEFAEIVGMKVGKTISISEFRPNSVQILNSDMHVQNVVQRNSPRNLSVTAKIYVVFELE